MGLVNPEGYIALSLFPHLSVLPPVYPISCSIFLIHAAVMMAINLTVLVSCVIATTLLASTFAEKFSLSRRRVTLWYTTHILAFSISVIAIAWAIRNAFEGPTFSLASAVIAITACIFALSLVKPLKARLEVLVGWKRNPMKATAGMRKFRITDTTRTRHSIIQLLQ